jgi:hypothetical protein
MRTRLIAGCFLAAMRDFGLPPLAGRVQPQRRFLNGACQSSRNITWRKPQAGRFWALGTLRSGYNAGHGKGRVPGASAAQMTVWLTVFGLTAFQKFHKKQNVRT